MCDSIIGTSVGVGMLVWLFRHLVMKLYRKHHQSTTFWFNFIKIKKKIALFLLTSEILLIPILWPKSNPIQSYLILLRSSLLPANCAERHDPLCICVVQVRRQGLDPRQAGIPLPRVHAVSSFGLLVGPRQSRDWHALCLLLYQGKRRGEGI